jgi:hypothetical protein
VGCAAAELDVADVDDDADDDDDDDDAVDDLLLLQPPIATPTTIVVAARPAAITEIFIAICSSGCSGHVLGIYCPQGSRSHTSPRCKIIFCDVTVS